MGSLFLAGTAPAGLAPDQLAEVLERHPGVLAGVTRPHPRVIVARVLGSGEEPVAAALGALIRGSRPGPAGG